MIDMEHDDRFDLVLAQVFDTLDVKEVTELRWLLRKVLSVEPRDPDDDDYMRCMGCLAVVYQGLTTHNRAPEWTAWEKQAAFNGVWRGTGPL